MNVRSAAVLIVIGSLVVVFLLKFIFIVHIIAPLRCEVCLVHVKLVMIVLSVLSLACTILNFIVYRQTKDLLTESRRLTLETNNVMTENDEDVEWIELSTIGNESRINHRASSASGSLADHSTQIRTIMSIHVNKKKLSQIELEATRTLITGVPSLVVMAGHGFTTDDIRLDFSRLSALLRGGVQQFKLAVPLHDRVGINSRCI